MYKTSLLSCTAASAIILLNIQLAAHAETLKVSEEKTVPVSDKTYEMIHAKTGGKITGKDLTVIGNKDINSNENKTAYAIKTEGTDSAITLQGSTTIKGTDSVISLGVQAKDGATFQMTGGTITVSDTGALFWNNNNNESKLKDVTISSGKDEAPLNFGVIAHQNGTVTLENIKVTQADNAVIANHNSKITISGGSFEAKNTTITALNGSSITLTDNAQITSSDDAGLTAKTQSNITITGGTITGKDTALITTRGGHIKVTGGTLKTKRTKTDAPAEGSRYIDGFGAFSKSSNSMIELGNTTISDTKIGLDAKDSGAINITGGSIKASAAGAVFENSKSDKNKLENVTISSDKNDTLLNLGVEADNSSVTLKDVTVSEATNAIAAYDNSKITISGGSFSGNDIGVHAQEGSFITLTDNAQIISSSGYALHANGLDSAITMTTGNITGKEAALAVENGGHIDLRNVSVTAGINGLQLLGLFDSKLDESNDPQKHQNNEINLTNADIHVENGTGIFVGAFTNDNIEDIQDLSIGTVNLTNSEIHADVLLGDGVFENPKSWGSDNYWNKKYWNKKEVKAISNGTFTLNANHSTLEGKANIAEDRNVHFDLKNNTIWTLKNSTKEKDADGNLLDIDQRARSDVSVLSLNNSSIIFHGPTEDHYHTLHIGSGKPDTSEVYKASGDAKIYFNTAWSDGIASADQKTDRLLIHGDVSGNTTVYIKSDSGDRKSVVNAAGPSNIGGLSLIQVSGKANEDSFKLANGYTTKNHLPYKYTLTAYGPESSHGKADVAQNLFDEKNENFWDFRLHKEILETGSSSGPSVIAPVAQTASYLVMPNALFYTGLTDMAKQNTLLANIRTSVLGKEKEKQTGFFLYTYGSTGTLSSERGPLKYGYGADIGYAALQGGVTLAAMEGQSATTHFGLVGTYGQLSFTPKDIVDASKNTLDKWSLTAYATIQHNNGLYVDTLLSYGMLKGNITNALIGKTAKLNDAKMLSVSTTIGKEFATSVESLTFEPQAQLAYQHLMFNTIEDADNFTVDMNNPSQWLIRVGGRLTKTVAAENNHPMSFYGKANLIKTFADDGTIEIGRKFDLDPMGAAIEGGIGINAQLSGNLSLHGDVSYQQKLQKTGISGASFSGGIRYQF
ncbi:Type V secretory pathway, adhesin AidA [Candidatus Bartonella washoeensis]|uniref:Outer membrane autotransporter barrel domain-containing protein n=1 Tax=Candidatus Bartonella washoeensis Sb944nv TaxID=1094563 RepID=J1J539_9HYPH|nr:autotransporter outer membrane beta-barrel domain-containing protein [Bartonella washoeensis]EJF78830.1 outer membrane autotransporter barrel domain-containing protein [Bartonella washoeensis Sb944nv]SPU27313.1 Type V secretory pathway, adhesin AidA [Bartonella washoeensis]